MAEPAPAPAAGAADTLSISADDGHRFEAQLHLPVGSPWAVLVFLPALGAAGRVYARLARELAAQGIAACITDWRGMVSSSVRAGRRSDFGYRHLLELDLPALRAAVGARLPGTPLWLGGHSLGGQLALMHAGAHADEIAGVLLVACGSVHMPAYPLRMQRDIRRVIWAARLTGAMFGHFPGHRIGFGGREARGLMRDWAHVAHTGRYEPQGSAIDYEAAVARLRLPVLAVTFEADHWSPQSAALALIGKLPAGVARHRHLDAAQTAGVALDHFSWTKQPALVAPLLAEFIADNKDPST